MFSTPSCCGDEAGRSSCSTCWSGGILCLVATTHFRKLDFGFVRVELIFGFSRVLFSYTLGSLLFLGWKTGRARVRMPPILLALALLGLFLVPPHFGPQGVVDLSIVAVCFPALLWISASPNPPPSLNRVARLLGLSSYAIYVLHNPLGDGFEQAWKIARHHLIAVDAPWPGLLFVAALILLTLMLDRFYDLPVRAFLKRKLTKTRPSA